MHASQLAEIGSWIATQSSTLVYGEQQQPLLIATNYWTSSKVRFQRWIAALKMFEQDFRSPDSGHDPWPAFEIVIQEILYSELLSRVWSATVLTHDWYHQTDELHGIVHAVHINHIEVKNRAMRVLLLGQAFNEKAFDRVNELRRRLERWTDLMLSMLPRLDQAVPFGFDRDRVRDFHEEQKHATGPMVTTRQKLLASSLSHELNKGRSPYAANPELNQEIAAGVLACFPSDRFEVNGLPKSVRRIWLEKSQNDTQMILDLLIGFEMVSETDGGQQTVESRYLFSHRNI